LPNICLAASEQELKDISYALGARTAQDLKSIELALDYNEFVQGLKDAMAPKAALRLNKEAIDKALLSFRDEQAKAYEAKMQTIAANNLKIAQDFLGKNKVKAEVKSTDSGLQYKVITKGSGPTPTPEQFVKINYRGKLIDGSEFDSSYSRKEPTVFQLKNLIPGWVEALQLMPVGSKWELFVPPSLGYGVEGVEPVIAPNSLLIFEIELLEIADTANMP